MAKHKSNLDVAECLKYWRAQKGLSQTKLAELGQTSALTISQLESGKRKARESTLKKILDGFGLTQDEFFSRRDRASAVLEAPAVVKPVEAPRLAPAPAVSVKEAGIGTRLSNLDLELLNRILNLDFDAKLETLRFLQNMR
ncbi:MAG: helix-turn-helix transcriptional regulator [bacterium]|nr:helix-turn-helix transcriptional regulator [bacterium]